MKPVGFARAFVLLLGGLLFFNLNAVPPDQLVLQTRVRIEARGAAHYESVEKTVRWDPRKTAIIICDMWDQHWCKGATKRVAEMAPVMNETVKQARNRGVFVIHAPSETMEFYKDTMYCSKMRPFVNHFRGTDLVVEHIEKYWCPSTTSASITGKPEFRFAEDGQTAANRGEKSTPHPTLSPVEAERERSAIREEDRAGNEEVREHIRKFKGRGQVTEPDVKPISPQESLKQFTLADGLDIHLAASEPDVRQPVSISFDERGRMWVVQYLQYPFPAGLKVLKYDEHLRAVFDKVPQPPPNHVQGADKITIFEDKDGDGFYETHKDFVTGLNIATSALPGRGGVWVMNPPYLLFYLDKNHDDVPDGPPEVHLSGFGLEDTHAVANSLSWGPDGWIYGAQGSTCTATVKGIRFLGQAIWRYHPVTREFELFAEGGGNTFCVEFDAKGRVYSGTNWGDERGLDYVQGGYYVKGWGKHGPLTNPHAYGFFNHMPHQGDKARFSHAFVIYEGATLPEKYFGKIFAVVPLQNRVQIAELIPDGSSFKTHDTDRAVQSQDRWFRPVDIKAGPDGAIYLADWYDIRLTHVDPRDTWDRSNGRIYRVASKGRSAAKSSNFEKLSSTELVDALSDPNKWVRQTARRLLAERNDTSVLPRLKTLAAGEEAQTALEALWTIHLLGGFEEPFALRELDHADEFVRLWTVRLLGDSRKVSARLQPRLVEMARYDKSPHVRGQLASSAKRLPANNALPIVAELLRRDEDAKDPHIPLLLWWAIENKAISDRAQVLKMFAQSDSWNSPIVAKEIMPRLVQRYAAEATRTDLDAAAALIRTAPGAAERERMISGIAEAFKGRNFENNSPALKAELASIDTEKNPEMMTLKLRLGAATERETKMAYKTVADENEKLKAKRIELIEALGQARDRESIDPLVNVAESSKWHSVRKAALQALQQFEDDAIGNRIVETYARLPKDQGVREQAVQVLSTRKEWSRALLQAVEENKVPRTNLPFEVLQRMKLHKDPTIDKSIDKLYGNLRQSPAQLQERMKAVEKTVRTGSGDALRGKQLFAATCASCHKLHGEGQNIGPDLTGYERSNLDFLLLALVDPNAAIREEYTNFELETTDGLLLTGFIVERAAQSVTIEDGQQGRTIVPKSRIKRLEASPVSRMPEGLLDAFSEQQVRDLFAYLRK